MDEKAEEINLRERLRILTNENKNEKINNFTFLKRLNNNKEKDIRFKSFSELKSKIFQKYSNNSKKHLKNKRLNQIFNKDKNYDSSAFIHKLEEVFNETYNINYSSNRNKNSIKQKNNFNSKLDLYINKVKKNHNKNFNNTNRNYIINNKIINISERKYNSNKPIDLNYHLRTNNNSTTYKLKKMRNDILYKNTNSQLTFNDKGPNDFSNLYNNKINNKKMNHSYYSGNYFNTYKHYEPVISATNFHFYKKNNLFSIRKNKIK